MFHPANKKAIVYTVKSLIEPPGGLSRGQGGLNLSPKCKDFRDRHDKEGKSFLLKYGMNHGQNNSNSNTNIFPFRVHSMLQNTQNKWDCPPKDIIFPAFIRFHTQINPSGYPALGGKREGGLNQEGGSIRDLTVTRHPRHRLHSQFWSSKISSPDLHLNSCSTTALTVNGLRFQVHKSTRSSSN